MLATLGRKSGLYENPEECVFVYIMILVKCNSVYAELKYT